MPRHRSDRCLQALGPLDAVKSLGQTYMHKITDIQCLPGARWEEEGNIQIGLLGLWVTTSGTLRAFW